MGIYFIFICLLLLLIVGLGVLLGSLDIRNIQAEWAERRCDPTVMFSAFLYKPANDPRSAATFATDNFTFCMNTLVGDVFKELLSPIVGVLTMQMGAAGTAGDVLNSVRNQVANAFRSFSAIFEDFFATYKRGTLQLSRITQMLRQAMLKVSAATVSLVFLGLSLMTSLLNTYDFIVKVVIIIMSIIVALIVLLFFALMPFLPLIFTVIAVLTGAGFGGAVGGMAGAFCIDPDAMIILTEKCEALKNIKVGDILGEGCGVVEGILETDTVGTLYSVEGVVMSGSHIVFKEGKPVFAAEIGTLLADHSNPRPSSLIVLNTSSHKIPIRTPEGITIFVGDWEEIDMNDTDAQKEWEKQVWEILQPGYDRIQQHSFKTSVFSSDVCVFVKKGFDAIQTPISSVKRGDMVMSLGGIYTNVLGVYRGKQSADNGVRVFEEDGIWRKKSIEVMGMGIGYQLVTDSGSFMIQYGKNKILSVRDFTEVGYKNIEKTYESTRRSLRK